MRPFLLLLYIARTIFDIYFLELDTPPNERPYCSGIIRPHQKFRSHLERSWLFTTWLRGHDDSDNNDRFGRFSELIMAKGERWSVSVTICTKHSCGLNEVRNNDARISDILFYWFVIILTIIVTQVEAKHLLIFWCALGLHFLRCYTSTLYALSGCESYDGS